MFSSSEINCFDYQVLPIVLGFDGIANGTTKSTGTGAAGNGIGGGMSSKGGIGGGGATTGIGGNRSTKGGIGGAKPPLAIGGNGPNQMKSNEILRTN